MSDTHTIFDGQQHCTGTKAARGKTVAMDCPYTGKGEEFSPTNLVEVALSGCRKGARHMKLVLWGLGYHYIHMPDTFTFGLS